MVKKTQPRTSKRSKPRPAPELARFEEDLLRKATIHLIHKHGGLFVATSVRWVKSEDGPTHWVIAFCLRYPTGHEGVVGDLIYDGKEFTLLTSDEIINERVRQIATDPEGIRQWNEYRTARRCDSVSAGWR